MSKQIPVRNVTPGAGGEKPASFYKSREKIQPRWIEGRFQKLRDFTVIATMGVYLVTPWLTWKGDPVVRFDLPNRRFDFFGLTFLPEDFFFLALLLMIAAFGLLFFTNLLGRVFCGYVCPQTVWTRFFVRIERLTEGDRNARLKLDKAPWSLEKVVRRGSKHLLWFALALLTALTFVGYFSPIRDLSVRLFTLDIGVWEAWWLFFFTAATYTNAGWLREQVCLYMCPYARFQSAMFDEDTLIVSYDESRGEPRGRGKKRRDTSDEHKELGDCVDCELCVQVCPTGIDIRDGLQYECITCAACIDACDEVMDSIGKPRGLVRYTTEHALAGRSTKIMRPRLIGYGIVVGALLTMFLTGLFLRVPLDVDVLRDRNSLYNETDDGLIENVYTLKLYNKSPEARTFALSVDVPEGIRYQGPAQVKVEAAGAEAVPVSLLLDPSAGQVRNSNIHFVVTAADDADVTVRIESRFITPVR
ncbi:MAG: cytochrome c oxidase accessory protein CcoG [Gammaproteobacteria bacterium]